MSVIKLQISGGLTVFQPGDATFPFSFNKFEYFCYNLSLELDWQKVTSVISMAESEKDGSNGLVVFNLIDRDLRR